MTKFWGKFYVKKYGEVVRLPRIYIKYGMF